MMEPSVSQEKADRLFQRDQIAALFKARPLAEIEAAELKRVTTHYQQRISECRRDLGMTIENVRRSRQEASGRVKRLDGAYRYQPHGKALGDDSGVPMRPVEWPTVHERPFAEPFVLKG